ncbi:MAG: glycosyltransferase [Thermodesulfobacteriota bacterium]
MKIFFLQKRSVGDLGAPAFEYVPRVLAELGHEVRVMGLGEGPSWASESRGVKVISVGPRDSWIRKLRLMSSEFRPDIYHVHIHHGCGLYPFIVPRAPIRPLFILDMRSPLLSTGFERKLRQWKNLIETLGYHAVCAHGIESGRTVIGTWREIHWVPSGVDMGLVPEWEGEPEGLHSPMRLVYTGSSSPRRGLPKMLEGVAVAAQEASIVLDMFVYDGRVNEINDLIRDLGLLDVVRVWHKVPREELLPRLQGYDVGLAYVPKVPYDPAPPIKTQEYLACGLAVVATDTVGNRLFVKEGVTGLLVSEDPHAYAQGILNIPRKISFPEARKAARMSMECFDWRRVVHERLLPLYHRLLPREGP